MGFGVKIKFDSNNEIVRTLTALNDSAPREAKNAMTQAVKPVLAAMRSLAPVDTKLLQRAEKSKAYITRKKDGVIGEVRVRGSGSKMVVRTGRKTASKADPYYYAHLVEGGVRQHDITFTDKKGKKHTVKHPGFPGRKFMEHAVRQTESQAMTILESELDAAFERMMNVN